MPCFLVWIHGHLPSISLLPQEPTLLLLPQEMKSILSMILLCVRANVLLAYSVDEKRREGVATTKSEPLSSILSIADDHRCTKLTESLNSAALDSPGIATAGAS